MAEKNRMNNPNPECHGVVTDPENEFDHLKCIDHVFDALTVRETEILRWFEAEGFVDVRVRRLAVCGPDTWECLMLRGHNDGCCTCDEVKGLVTRLAGDIRCVVQQDETWAVVWTDRIGTHFQLKPKPPQ